VVKVARKAVMLLAIAGAAACDYRSRGVAAGLTAESLPQVRRGMSRAEVLRVLGRPLSEGGGVLTYAQSRRLSVGNLSMFQPGQSCAVVLVDGVVAEAHFVDAGANVRCSCRAEACGEGWASQCLGRLR
jgi:hypothetical protein